MKTRATSMGPSGVTRSPRGHILGGVCTGLGQYLKIDASIIRLGFLVLTLAWGAGIALYGALWLMLRQDGVRYSGGLRDQVGKNWRHARARLRMRGRQATSRLRGSRIGSRSKTDPWWGLGVGLLLLGLALMVGSLGALDWLTPLRAVALSLCLAGGALLLAMTSG